MPFSSVSVGRCAEKRSDFIRTTGSLVCGALFLCVVPMSKDRLCRLRRIIGMRALETGECSDDTR